ncbi:MAG: hypothetical protein ACRDD1_18105 [Planctomycetia bacterium]
MGLLDAAESWLTDTLHDSQTRNVRYSRAGYSAFLPVIPADHPIYVDQPQAPQARIEYGERWYQIRLSDFADAGFTEPRVGDRITETLAGVQRVFEVAKSDTEAAWKWLDELRTAIQVRTKAV